MAARETAKFLLAAAIAAFVCGCDRDPAETAASSALTGSCAWFAGRWTWNGCGETECTFWEDNCQVHYECTSRQNAISGDGSVTGNTFTFGGGQCTATVSGKSMSGHCPGCSFTASHR